MPAVRFLFIVEVPFTTIVKGVLSRSIIFDFLWLRQNFHDKATLPQPYNFLKNTLLTILFFCHRFFEPEAVHPERLLEIQNQETQPLICRLLLWCL